MLIIGYYLASVLGHLEVSLWLVEQRESELLGAYKLADFLPHAGALLFATVVVWQARRAWHGYNHARTLAAWAAWCIVVALVDRFLIYSLPEYLHYPQYALLAWMIASLLDPDRTAFAVGPILLGVTVLGIADEALQYTWVTISYSNYLDFNDFLLNLLGATAGLLLFYGFAPSRPIPSSTPASAETTPSSRKRCAQRGVIRDLDNLPMSAAATAKTSARYGLIGFAWLGTAMLLAIAAINVTSTDPDRLQPIERQPSYNTWIPGPHAGRYYVLDPVTGALVLTGLGALASAAPIMRRRNKHAQFGLAKRTPTNRKHSRPRTY